MKILIQACIASLVIHLIYIVSSTVLGYIKTLNYRPDVAGKWDEIEFLQNEVAFGMVISPMFYIISFIGVAIICGLILFLYKSIYLKGM